MLRMHIMKKIIVHEKHESHEKMDWVSFVIFVIFVFFVDSASHQNFT